MESPSRLRDLAPADVPVVMSSQAWEDYGVTMSPYFVLVGADGEVRGEGAASSLGAGAFAARRRDRRRGARPRRGATARER